MNLHILKKLNSINDDFIYPGMLLKVQIKKIDTTIHNDIRNLN